MHNLLTSVLTKLAQWFPSLSRSIGRQHYETYVCAPVPDDVNVWLHTSSPLVVFFEYTPPFHVARVLAHEFEAIESSGAALIHRLMLRPHVSEDCQTFYRALHGDLVGAVWLYLDEANGRGAFYVV